MQTDASFGADGPPRPPLSDPVRSGSGQPGSGLANTGPANIAAHTSGPQNSGPQNSGPLNLGTPLPRGAGSAAAAAAPPAAPPAARRALWAALAPFAADPRVLERNRIVAARAGAAATPFDMMRTKLLARMRENSWRRVAITSPSIACGKTMTSLNLAFSLSRQPDLHTMLIELDLRRPTLARVLGLPGTTTGDRQFSRALEGGDPPEAHLLRHGTNLALATSRQPARNPAELLQGPGAAGVLDRLEQHYAPDLMIFDMPPMLMTDDTLAFIDQVDCVLLVGAAGTTSAEDVRRCQTDLEGRCNLLGVVLNKCRHPDRSERYGYYA